jgi:putative addiction module CopG family antidote
MNISLAPELERVVQRKVKSGQYPNADAFIHEAIQRLVEADEDEQEHASEIRERIAAAERQIDRGEYTEYDETTLRRLPAEIRARGMKWPAATRTKTSEPLTSVPKILRYIELKSGYCDNGPAWIGYVTPSKSGRTLYFNGHALGRRKGMRRGASGGNYCDEAGEWWVSGIKKNGQDRHWAGSGKIMVEAAAVAEYLEMIGAKALDKSRYEITHGIVETDIESFTKWANTSRRDVV